MSRRAAHGDTSPIALQTRANLGINYRDAGRLPEAIALLEPLEREGRTNPALSWVKAELLTAYILAGKAAEALPMLKAELADARKAQPAGSLTLAAELVRVGGELNK